MRCDVLSSQIILQQDERDAISVSSDGSHRHDPNVVGTESKLLNQVVTDFHSALTRAQKLLIKRSRRGIALNDDRPVLRKPQEVCDHGIQFFSSRVREFLRAVSLDDEQLVVRNPGAFLGHILLKFLGLILDWRKASEIVEASVLEESTEEEAVFQRLQIFG